MLWSLNLCRICAHIKETLTPIFERGSSAGIDLKIKRCLSVNVSKDDLKPKQVCQECLVKLNDFYNFTILYYDSNYRFESLLFTSNGAPIQQDEEVDFTLTNEHENKQNEFQNCNIIDVYKDEILPLEDLNIETPDLEQNLLNEIVAKANVDIDLRNLVPNNEIYTDVMQNKALSNLQSAYLDISPAVTSNVLNAEKEPCSGNYENSVHSYNTNNTEELKNNQSIISRKRNKGNVISVKTICQAFEKHQPKYEQALSKTRWNRTKRNTNSKNNFPCAKCEKSFSRRHCLNEHIKNHGNIRPFVCEICGKGFALQWDLTSHRNVHTDLFSCPHCGKRFSAPSKLQRHVRTHTGERPFLCTFTNCGKSFSDKCNLTGHQVTHINIRNFTCDICKRSYKTKNQLKDHMQAHSDNPIFKCNVCNKFYRWRTNLVNHVKKHNLTDSTMKT